MCFRLSLLLRLLPYCVRARKRIRRIAGVGDVSGLTGMWDTLVAEPADPCKVRNCCWSGRRVANSVATAYVGTNHLELTKAQMLFPLGSEFAIVQSGTEFVLNGLPGVVNGPNATFQGDL